MVVMSPLIPWSRDQEQIKRKRKSEQTQCITKKKPKTNLFENKKVQNTATIPKKTRNSKKHKVKVFMLFPNKTRSDLPTCCCFRLIYIISDRKIECSGGGLSTPCECCSSI